MIVKNEYLERVDNHWAVLAIGREERERALEIANAKLVKKPLVNKFILTMKILLMMLTC